jgi:hypothetical protein
VRRFNRRGNGASPSMGDLWRATWGDFSGFELPAPHRERLAHAEEAAVWCWRSGAPEPDLLAKGYALPSKRRTTR